MPERFGPTLSIYRMRDIIFGMSDPERPEELGQEQLPVFPGFREIAQRRRRLVAELVARRLALGLTQTEVAARMGCSLDEYYSIVQDAASCRLASLDEAVASSTAGSADPFREAADERFRAALSRAIEGLPERERLVMSLYYSDGLNLKEIGAVLKVTESRVCQLHGQALVRLKARLADWREGSVDEQA